MRMYLGEIFCLALLVLLFNSILLLCLLTDNAGVIVNPKGEMKGMLTITSYLYTFMFSKSYN